MSKFYRLQPKAHIYVPKLSVNVPESPAPTRIQPVQLEELEQDADQKMSKDKFLEEFKMHMDQEIEKIIHRAGVRFNPYSDCSICKDKLNTSPSQMTKCKHFFHKDCISGWTTMGRHDCPICRGSMGFNS